MPQAGSAWIPITPDLRNFHRTIAAQMQSAGTEAGRVFATAFTKARGDLAGGLAPRDPAGQGAKAGGAFAEGFRRSVDAALKALPDIKLGADATPAERRIQEIRAELENLSGKRIGIDISDAEAVAKVRALQAELDKIGRRDPSVRIKADTAAASAALAKFAAEEKSVSRLGKLGQGSFFQPSLLGTALALTPAAIPLLAGVTAGVGALGLSFAGAAAGAGLFGLLAKSALTQAGTAATAVQTAQTAYAGSLMGIRQQYAANMAVATTHAQRLAALTTEQKALTAAGITQMKAEHAAYAQMTPQQIALSKAVGGLQNAWQGVRQATTPLISGALLPWMGSATLLLKDIQPAVAPIAGIFRNWGQVIQEYFASHAGSDELHRMATEFGQFSANQLQLIGMFILDIGKGIFSLGRDLAASGANFSAASIWLYNMGQGFASWAASKQARGDVQGFLRYLHTEGPVVTGVLRNLGSLLPGIFRGATAAGGLELKAIGGLLSLIAKLPKSWQAPLTEAAGALLLLSKTGLLKVGFTVVGAAAGWIKKLFGGASVDIGAAGMQRAGDTMLTAAGAMQKAADTMAGGAAAGDAGAAGAAGEGAAGSAGKLGLGGLAAAIPAVGAGVAIGAGLKAGGDALAPRGSTAGKLSSALQGSGSALVTPSVAGLAGYIAWVTVHMQGLQHDVASIWDKTWNNTAARTARGFHDVAGAFDTGRHAVSRIWDLAGHDITSAWNTTWNNTIGRLNRGKHDVAHGFDLMRHGTAATLDGIRHDAAHYWDLTWNNTIGRLQRGVRDAVSDFGSFRHRTAVVYDGMRHDIAHEWDVIWSATTGRIQRGIATAVSWFAGLPGRATRALSGLGRDLENLGSRALSMLLTGAKSVVPKITSFLGGFAHGIVGVFKKIWGWFSPSSVMYEGGKSLMDGLANGIRAHAHKAIAASQKAAAGAAGKFTGHFGAGVSQWAGDVRQVLAMLGLPQALAGNVLYQMQTESGGNPNAINLTDSNAQHGDPSRGLLQTIMGTFLAYAGPFRNRSIFDPLANIYAAVNYAMHRYGRTLMSGGMGMGSGHGYDEGGWLMPGLTTVVNATRKPEPVLSDAQWQMLSHAVRGGDGGGEVTYNLHFDGLTAGAIESHVRHGLAAAAVAQRRALRTGRRR